MSASKAYSMKRSELKYNGRTNQSRKGDPSHCILTLVVVHKFLLTDPKENFQDIDFFFPLVVPFL